MKLFCRGFWGVMGVLAVCLANPAGAQENLDLGKTPAQLFASDCAFCHKSPQGLAKAGRFLGLDSFLREHYTASRESAAAIAAYLRAAGDAPAAPARRAKKGTAKGDSKSGDKTKTDEKKPDTGKSGLTLPGINTPPQSTEPKATESKATEPKAGEAKPSEPKASESKPDQPKGTEPKPAQSPKSD
ncbi:MAG: hypothetical protein HY543_05670 [Deltaproteobacteria bacterium]|nr:hypothetical protein [Deltaproteobacteria bacterium]